MDLDLSLRMNKPASLTDASSLDDKRNYEKWDRSNRLSLMIIKRGIPEALGVRYLMRLPMPKISLLKLRNALQKAIRRKLVLF